MNAEPEIERRPGTIVTICGLAVSALTLFVVHLLEEADFSVMGFYLNYVIPAGALLVGVCSGLGFALSSRYLQVKLGWAYVWGMLLTGLITYWCAQYLTYSHLIERANIPAEAYGFTDYMRDSCELMSFKSDNANEPAKPLGGWGYVVKLLEMIGYVAGAMIPALIVSGLPYCKQCQKYLKPHRSGYLHSPEIWSEIKSLGKKERTAALEQVIAAIGPRAMQGAGLLAKASLAETEAFVAQLAPQADKKAAARVLFAVEKCPTCDAHQVKVSLINYTIDKDSNTSVLVTLDKITPPPDTAASASPSS
jgi:hypothetical protein